MSLLYYFGMLTISGTYKGKTKLTIPNQVVREQIYTYLLSTYNEAELNFSSYEKNELASALAYDGDWESLFRLYCRLPETLHFPARQAER